jgi:hypothetical protein
MGLDDAEPQTAELCPRVRFRNCANAWILDLVDWGFRTNCGGGYNALAWSIDGTVKPPYGHSESTELLLPAKSPPLNHGKDLW